MRRAIAFLLSAAALAGCGSPSGAESGATAAKQAPIRRATPRPSRSTRSPVADFNSPWAMTFLPDGRMLVTEKAGRMLLVSADGKAAPDGRDDHASTRPGRAG